MKLNKFLISSAMMAIAGLMMVGCNENPIDTPPTGTAPGAPTNLQFSSKTATSVMVSWNAPAGAGDTAITGYEITWAAPGGASSSATTVGASVRSTLVSNVTSGVQITFSVKTLRGTLKSVATSRDWAGASRYTQDAGNSQIIKIYEKASAKGSGLILDPGQGGPRNVSVATANPAIQLGMVIDANNVIIGTAFGFPEFANANSFDQNVFVSKLSYVAPSLDEWYLSSPLNTLIDTVGTPAGTANLNAFTFQHSNLTTSNGQGFIVRTGTGSNIHYARVFIVNRGSSLIQTDADGKYVELHISYQGAANLPFAKTAGRIESAVSGRSGVRR